MLAADDGTTRQRDEGFVSVHETHAAVVFLVGGYAYKLKKPVDLGFLDFITATSAKRRASTRWS
jgi:Uncharacterized protein conserved in bacteria